ncbi:transglycosylase SLT domain-containing protein [Desulfobacterales bacterium HSG2]|nr:transglycosylase SLT domain-containing protein [Desulfobacterales bacterium HSG2]
MKNKMFMRMFRHKLFRPVLLILVLLSVFTVLWTRTEDYFPIPPSLEDNVAFWEKIYTEVSVTEGLLHDREYPLVVYKKIKVGNRIRQKKKIVSMLKRISGVSESEWSGEEKRIYEQFLKHAPKTALKEAAKRIRFQAGQKERFRDGLVRSGMYLDEIRDILKEYDVPARLAYLPHVESSFNIEARSKVGAAGMWQFMKGTGKQYLKVGSLIDERHDPTLSTVAAAKLLSRNYESLGSWPLAVTAYNHGLYGMKRAVASTGSEDIGTIIEKHKSRTFRFASKNFYSCFLAASEVAENHKKYFKKVKLKPPFRRNMIRLEHPLPSDMICDSLDMPSETFRRYNPALRSALYKNNGFVPKGQTICFTSSVSSASARKALASAYSEWKKSRPAVYKVKKGDYLDLIARKMGVSATEIARANGLSNKNRIYPGQVLKIP